MYSNATMVWSTCANVIQSKWLANKNKNIAFNKEETENGHEPEPIIKQHVATVLICFSFLSSLGHLLFAAKRVSDDFHASQRNSSCAIREKK